tara:strand:- start:104 stop:433 length:330 start_codon:yes stop_codon:yes gene_type:complete
MIGIITSNAFFNVLDGQLSAKCKRKYNEKSSNEFVCHVCHAGIDTSVVFALVADDVDDDANGTGKDADTVQEEQYRKLSIAIRGIPVKPINNAFSGCLDKFANKPNAQR